MRYISLDDTSIKEGGVKKRRMIIMIIINYYAVRSLLTWHMPLAIDTLRFIFTKCIDRLHVSTSSETSFCFLSLFFSSSSCVFFTEFSSNRAHPHNFLIRFCRKNEKDRNIIAPRLLFFFLYANERRTSVFGILVLLLFFSFV